MSVLANRATTRSAMAQETCSIYKFVPKPSAPVEPTPPWATGARPSSELEEPPMDSPQIVRMTPYRVSETFKNERLHAIFQRQEEGARDAAIAHKLGFAEHHVDAGKLRFGAVTFFYIPVVVGMRW